MNAHLSVGSSRLVHSSTIETRLTPRRRQMRKEREALLVATLAGLVIVGAAAFVVQPTMGNSQSAPRLQFSQTALPVLPVQVFGKTA